MTSRVFPHSWSRGTGWRAFRAGCHSPELPALHWSAVEEGRVGRPLQLACTSPPPSHRPDQQDRCHGRGKSEVGICLSELRHEQPQSCPSPEQPPLGGDTGLMERPGSKGVNPTVQVTQRPESEGVNPTVQVTPRPGSEGVNPTIQVTPRPGSEGTSHCTVFTYFKGDINSVVDEHFSRALRCAEARPRRKPEDMERAGEKLPSMPWLQPPIWPHPYLGASLPPAGRTSEGGPMTTAQYQPDNCPNLRAAAADPWLLPSSRAQGGGSLLYQPPLLQLHQMLPAVDSERQYSTLREPVPGHRAAPGTHLPRHKTIVPSPWTGIAPGLPEGMNPEVGQRSEHWRNEEGFEHQAKQKDVYWY